MPSHTEFIPRNLKIRAWEDIEPYFSTLQRRRPRTRNGLVELIHHYSDVLSVYEERSTKIELASARDTQDMQAKARMQNHLDTIALYYDIATSKVDKHIRENRAYPSLRGDPVYRQIHTLFKYRVEDDPQGSAALRIEIQRIERRCEELIGSLRVSVGGKTITLAEGWDHLSTPDRETRQEIWLAIQRERERIRHQLDTYFSALVELRHRLGRKAGHKNYRKYEHFGSYPAYDIADATKFHRSIKREVVPLARDITHQHRERLGLERKMLRPWDTDAAFWGFQAPLPGEEHRIAETTGAFLENAIDMLARLHPDFGKKLAMLNRRGLLDLEARPHKLPGTYCESFEGRRLPFIFMHSTNTHSDRTTLTHEFGHALHILETRDEPLIFYRFFGTDYTLAETMSETMELLCSTKWDGPTEAKIAAERRSYLEELIRFLPWSVVVDKFQQWLYEHPHCSPTERDAYFVDLMKQFYPEEINWKGLENYRKKYWQMSGHILTSPFYYIQYSFAGLAAIEMYRNYLTDPDGTLERYLRGLRLGARKPHPAVWREMGITLNFSPKGFDRSLEKIPELMGFVMQEIEKLDQEIEKAI